MFDDITKIDATFLKSKQANPSMKYGGNNKKRQHPANDTSSTSDPEESRSGYERQDNEGPAPSSHALDIEV